MVYARYQQAISPLRDFFCCEPTSLFLCALCVLFDRLLTGFQGQSRDGSGYKPEPASIRSAGVLPAGICQSKKAGRMPALRKLNPCHYPSSPKASSTHPACCGRRKWPCLCAPCSPPPQSLFDNHLTCPWKGIAWTPYRYPP